MNDCVTVQSMPERDAAARAFLRLEEEILTLPEDELRRMNVDVPSAVTIALGALPRLEAHREAIARLPDHTADLLDRLRDAALAAYHAHLASVARPKDESERARLLEEARPLREALLLDAEALAHRRLVAPERVASIRAGRGNLDTAGDLLALASLFAEAWPSIQGRTAATVEEIERAGELGARLLSAIAEDAPAGSTWGDVRQRAFSLFASIYEECRRAIAYLRWHERDAEAIAPSLYRRGPRRPSPSEAPEEAAA